MPVRTTNALSCDWFSRKNYYRNCCKNDTNYRNGDDKSLRGGVFNDSKCHNKIIIMIRLFDTRVLQRVVSLRARYDAQKRNIEKKKIKQIKK